MDSEWKRETTAFVVVVADDVVMSTFTSNHTAFSAYLVDTAVGCSALTLFNRLFFCQKYVCMKDMKINLYLSI